MREDIDVLLFDLGGVVVPWVGLKVLSDLSGLSPAQIKERFASSETLRGHEVGAVDNEIFLAELKAQFNLEMDLVRLAKAWNSWVHPPFPGVLEAIQSLQGQYRTACLSNTNALHWAHLHDMFDVHAMFDPALASHEMQLAKPDRAIFEETLDRLKVPASRVLFFDDTIENVEMARETGLKAERVDPAYGVLPVLKRLGFVR